MSASRFKQFNPEERELLRVLLQEHANAVSQVAIATGARVAQYLVKVEALEAECNDIDD